MLLLLVVAPAGFPVQLSYVTSDSMEPTLETNDGFLVVSSDAVETGDIVTFWSDARDGYVTHRVVGETESGYLTKGDDNPSTDQAGGHPPVSRTDVVGEVATIRGEPVVVPGFGLLVSTLRGLSSALLVGVTLLLLLVSVRESGRTERPARSVLTVRSVLRPVFVASLVSAIALMYVGGAVHDFTYVAVASSSAGPNTLTVGEAETTTMVVNRSAPPFTRTVVSAENMAVANRTENASSITVAARIPPPESTGRYPTSLRVHTYPAVLPTAVLRALHGVHPLVAGSAVSIVVFLPMYLLSVLLWDGRTPIRPSRSRVVHRIAGVFE